MIVPYKRTSLFWQVVEGKREKRLLEMKKHFGHKKFSIKDVLNYPMQGNNWKFISLAYLLNFFMAVSYSCRALLYGNCNLNAQHTDVLQQFRSKKIIFKTVSEKWYVISLRSE
jgi:hypothetical protein